VGVIGSLLRRRQMERKWSVAKRVKESHLVCAGRKEEGIGLRIFFCAYVTCLFKHLKQRPGLNESTLSVPCCVDSKAVSLDTSISQIVSVAIILPVMSTRSHFHSLHIARERSSFV
jgi:hypothetical protein